MTDDCNDSSYMVDDFRVAPQDRILLTMNDNRIEGSTRLQKYGFLLAKQYASEMREIERQHDVRFYADWKPHYYGPYSSELDKDMQLCKDNDIIRTSTMETGTSKNMQVYVLTIKGRARWRSLNSHIRQLKKFDEKIKTLQKIPFYTLLRRVYDAYPEYTVESRIKGSLNSGL